MRRVLFVMLHPGFVRYYEGALRALAARGHDVHLAFEITRAKLGEDQAARRIAEASPHMTCGTTPPRSESVRSFLTRADRTATRSGVASGDGDGLSDVWESLATTVRLMLDYLRFFDPVFARADLLRGRAEKRLPRTHARLVRLLARATPGRRFLKAVLGTIERLIPPSPVVLEYVRKQKPDLLVVTPLIELGSQQVDYVKAARALGVRSTLAVASWDNLTSKGLIRVIPDHVIVWNETQKGEAVALHGVPPERVAMTGAQVFDPWFEGRPSRSRVDFCAQLGLDTTRPFVMYLGSSSFIAPQEVPFFERWLSALRADEDPTVAAAGVLIRPHPANSRQWRVFDSAAFANVALWPPIGTDFNHPDFARDFFDSLYYSEAVVGINTSALLEAGIVGRPVFTVTTTEFAHSQEGTLHFHHLVNTEGGLVRVAGSIDEHVEQLRSVLRGDQPVREEDRRFIQAFIRPLGLDRAAAPLFADTIEQLAAMQPPAALCDTWSERVGRALLRPLASMSRTLAEDRPLWVYALRPLLRAGVVVWGWESRARAAARHAGRRVVKRLRRATHGSRRVMAGERRRTRRFVKQTVARLRSAGSAARRVVRRQV